LGQNRGCRESGCNQEPKSQGVFHEEPPLLDCMQEQHELTPRPACKTSGAMEIFHD
jgi:hypothetical protein